MRQAEARKPGDLLPLEAHGVGTLEVCCVSRDGCEHE